MVTLFVLCAGVWLLIDRVDDGAVVPRVTQRLTESPSPRPVRDTRSGSASSGNERNLAVQALTGWVTDEAGAPIAGATVCAAHSHTRCCQREACTQSAGTGFFRLEPGHSPARRVIASAAGYLSRFLVLTERTAGASPIQLTLERGGVELSGKVADATGGPVLGALVTAEVSGEAGPVATTWSKADGSFQLDVPSGALLVRARSEAYAEAETSAYAPSRGLVLVLVPEASISGRVVLDATSEGLPGLSVSATPSDGGSALAVLSGADGSFHIDALGAGSYRVEAAGETIRSNVEWARLGVAETRDGIELRVTPAASLGGTIEVDGAICERGSLEIAGAVQASAATEADGSVRIGGLLPGRYAVTARCEQAVPLTETIELDPMPVRRVFALASGLSLTGRVVSAAGAAVSGAHVSVYPVSSGAEAEGAAGAAGGHCASEATGEFACAGLAPGPHDCEVSLNGRTSKDKIRVDVTPGVPARVVLRLPAAGSIRAELPADFAALAQAGAFARPVGGGPIMGLRDERGFTFEPLELGTYTVYLSGSAEDVVEPQQVVLANDGQVATLSFEPPSLRSISGRVVDANGAPVVDAWVRASAWPDASVSIAPVLSDESGSFSLEGLLPGTYEIRAASAAGESVGERVKAGAGAVLVRVLEFGSMSGRVSTPSGEPASAFSLEYRHAGQIATLTGTNGRWSVQELAPGTYELEATSAAGRASREVQLAPGGHLDVLLELSAAPQALGTAPSSIDRSARAPPE
jgi:hypothetical protein